MVGPARPRGWGWGCPGIHRSLQELLGKALPSILPSVILFNGYSYSAWKSKTGQLLGKSLGTTYHSKASLSRPVAGAGPGPGGGSGLRAQGPGPGGAAPALTCCPGGRGRRCPGTGAAGREGRERSEGGSGPAGAAAPPPARTPRAGRGAAARGSMRRPGRRSPPPGPSTASSPRRRP